MTRSLFTSAGWHAPALASVLTLAVSCVDALDIDPTESSERTESTSSRLIGGTGTFEYPAVLYLDRSCTGSLIAPNVVLTAAHCQIQPQTIAEVITLDEVQSSHLIAEVVHHRRHSGGNAFSHHDVSLVRLEEPAEIEPLPVQLTPLPELEPESLLHVIGFGVTNAEPATGAGTKREALFPLHGRTNEYLQGSDAGKSICYGDSGGPGLLTMDAVETVVGITRSHFDNCGSESQWTRTDTYADEFIVPYMDAWSGPCVFDGECVEDGCRTPDPDCAPCGIDGVCSEGCPTVDSDCPLGMFDGEGCGSNDDCESRLCLDEPDGSGKYCAGQCSETDKACVPGLLCESTEDGFRCLRPLEEPEKKSGGCTTAGQSASSVWLLAAIVMMRLRRPRKRERQQPCAGSSRGY